MAQRGLTPEPVDRPPSRRWRAVALVLLGCWLAGLPAAVEAHESREVAGGKYQLRVGFIDEPAYQGLVNGLELTICTGPCRANQETGLLTNGLAGAYDSVKVEVIFGGQAMPLRLAPVPRQPGRYQARFVPTRAGDYTFHLSGAIGADPIDERFTSSPTTFDSVEPATAVQFPDKPGYPAGGTGAGTGPAPTAGATEVQALRTQLRDQQEQLEMATASVASARLLALAGLVAGCLGGLMGGVAVVLAGRSARAVGPAQPEAPEEES